MNKPTLLLTGIIFTIFSCQTPDRAPIFDDGTSKLWNVEQAPFFHGVASGDPLSNAVIIWTRVTPEFEQRIEGTWEMATDPAMKNIVQSGPFDTSKEQDYTVKVDVQELSPGTYYYYQFKALDKTSPIGRTKTTPVDATQEVNLAVVSCSNYEAGFFNALGRIAAIENLDAVLHLGDYIYEYASGIYGDTTLGRFHLPNKEILELQDYRTRYAQYRLDEDFQKAHQMHPFITIWDDHEITNNSHKTGAQNHQPDEEGDYNVRKSVARKAYYEWLPIRDNEAKHLYRSFHFGSLVDLVMLDERLEGRSPQVDSTTQSNFRSTDRSMLGKEQLGWFKDQLKNSTAQWKVIGNQVIFSQLDISALGWRGVINTDAWDGYPAEQSDIINFLKNTPVNNVIFVTGDTHRAWAFEVPESIAAYKEDSTATIAVEFGSTSITSSNTDERVSVDTTIMIEKMSMNPKYNPHMKYNNQRDHGYILLSLTAEKATAAFKVVETIKIKSTQEKTDKTAIVQNGTNEIILE